MPRCLKKREKEDEIFLSAQYHPWRFELYTNRDRLCVEELGANLNKNSRGIRLQLKERKATPRKTRETKFLHKNYSILNFYILVPNSAKSTTLSNSITKQKFEQPVQGNCYFLFQEIHAIVISDIRCL